MITLGESYDCITVDGELSRVWAAKSRSSGRNRSGGSRWGRRASTQRLIDWKAAQALMVQVVVGACWWYKGIGGACICAGAHGV